LNFADNVRAAGDEERMVLQKLGDKLGPLVQSASHQEDFSSSLEHDIKEVNNSVDTFFELCKQRTEIQRSKEKKQEKITEERQRKMCEQGKSSYVFCQYCNHPFKNKPPVNHCLHKHETQCKKKLEMKLLKKKEWPKMCPNVPKGCKKLQLEGPYNYNEHVEACNKKFA
jgi:hypothetical protein